MRARFLIALLLLLFPLRLSAGEEQGLQEFGSGSFREILRSVAGRPAIIHFWGTTCGPCLAELPEWGKLFANRPDTNLIMIHAEPSPRSARLLPEIISRAGLTRTQNWAFGDGSSERLRFEIDPAWQGELPMTLLVSANGSKRVIIGPANFEEIQHWLETETHPRSTASERSAPAVEFKSSGAKPDALHTSF